MLLSQRIVLCFSIVIALFLSSCMPVVPGASGSNVPESISVPTRWIKENSQIYISRKGNFCFAYPFDFFLDGNNNLDEENSIALRVVNECSSTNIVDASNGLIDPSYFPDGIATSSQNLTTLKVFYQENKSESYILDDFIQERLRKFGDMGVLYRIDFHIDDELAWMINTSNLNDSFLLVFTKHGDKYYQISFLPSFSNINKNSEKDLVNLFMAIIETFTFLD